MCLAKTVGFCMLLDSDVLILLAWLSRGYMVNGCLQESRDGDTNNNINTL